MFIDSDNSIINIYKLGLWEGKEINLDIQCIKYNNIIDSELV